MQFACVSPQRGVCLQARGVQKVPPLLLNFDRLWVFLIPFCIRMLKTKAQIARESIKKKPRAVRNFGLRARDVRARTYSFDTPPPPPHENPGSAPARGIQCKVCPLQKYISFLIAKEKNVLDRFEKSHWNMKLKLILNQSAKTQSNLVQYRHKK